MGFRRAAVRAGTLGLSAYLSTTETEGEPRNMSDTPRRTRPWVAVLRALVGVLWVYLWIIPLVAALDLDVAMATAALVALTALFVWRNVMRPLRSRSRSVAALRLRPWRRYAGWLTVAAAAQFGLIFATLVMHEQLAKWRFLPKLPSSPDLIPPDFYTHPLGPVAMFLAMVVLTPAVEEFGFRGRMQYRLEGAVGVVPAILTTAIIFSALHGVMVAAHHLPFAIFIGWVVWRTGSLWTAVYVHALNNAAVLLLLYLTRDWAWDSQDLPDWLWPYAIAVGVTASAALLATAWRIHRVAQTDRPRAGAWPRRRSLEGDLTAVWRR